MVVRWVWSVTLSFGLEAQLYVEIGEAGNSLSHKLIAVISSAYTVDHALSVCFLVPMLVGPPFRKKRKAEVGLRVYTEAIEVASGSWSSCVNSADPVSGFARTCLSIMIVSTLFT